MQGRPLTHGQRYVAIVLAGFAAVALAVAAVVAAVRSEWSWAAVGALAAAVQAIGVLGALIFAWVQIRTAREEARRRRKDELIDELVVLTFRGLDRAVQDNSAAWGRALLYKDSAVDFADTEVEQAYEELYRRDRAALRESASVLRGVVDDLTHVMLRLGRSREPVLMELQSKEFDLPTHRLPVSPSEPFEFDHGVLGGMRNAATAFYFWVREYVRTHVPSEVPLDEARVEEPS